MPLRDAFTMLLLAAIWGASFLFLRQAAPVAGPVLVAACRTVGAALLLLPLLLWQGQGQALRAHWRPLVVAALLSTVLPFLGLSQAARSLPAGLLSILNATTPLWGAVVGCLWAGERMGWQRALGLLMGFAGVALLAADHSQLDSDAAPAMPVALALGATLMYATAVHFNKRHLRALTPLGTSAGTLAVAGLMLIGPAIWLGPLGPGPAWDMPSSVWLALASLAVLCTGLAYVLFYRLIERIGPSRSLAVTFLIPAFGMLWGALFLNERVSVWMLASAAIIVLGTLLSARGA